MTAPAPEALVDVADVARRIDALLAAGRILQKAGEDVAADAMKSRLVRLAARYDELSRPPGARPVSCPRARLP